MVLTLSLNYDGLHMIVVQCFRKSNFASTDSSFVFLFGYFQIRFYCFSFTLRKPAKPYKVFLSLIIWKSSFAFTKSNLTFWYGYFQSVFAGFLKPQQKNQHLCISVSSTRGQLMFPFCCTVQQFATLLPSNVLQNLCYLTMKRDS